MSRHRDFRNINVQDELDDDALSDGGDNEMTEEEYAQMQDGLEQVRGILGTEEASGLSDNEIKDTLWHYFFDIEKTVHWAMEEQQRRQLARERKDIDMGKDLPPIPQGGEIPSNLEYYNPEQFSHNDPNQSVERRIPLIVLAQQQGGFVVPEPDEYEDYPRGWRLSPITELTERTETTPGWPVTRQLTTPSRVYAPSSSASSSYGELIEPQRRFDAESEIFDPNLIPVSPSASAINELSLYEPAPSIAASDSASNITSIPRQTSRQPSRQPSEVAPPPDTLPEIPDYASKSSKQVPTPAPVPAAPPAKKSKLSMLASSRASTMTSRSESSRSSGIALSGSVKTFPALRPSAESTQPPEPSTRASTLRNPSEVAEDRSTISPFTSSVVRRAIETALQLEAIDNEPPRPRSRQSPVKPMKSESTKSESVKSEASTEVPPPSAPILSGSPSPSLHAFKEVHTFGPPAARPPSKLAMLAMAKANANANANKAASPNLPKPVTEYLTPVANGPTVTTAITTSYQTLRTLTDPALSRVIPEQYVVPIGFTPPEQKQSKLAMKIKKAGAKPTIAAPAEEETIPLSPMFSPKSSLHVHKKKDRRNTDDTRERRKSRSQHRRKSDRLPPPEPSSPTSFKFDGPSPDDIIFNARRGTSLAGKHAPLSTSTPRKQSSK